MKNLKTKMKKQGGFTLVEMLIVVAIIAILIAISIPLVQKALEKSRHAVDQANIRDAIALGTIEYLTEPDLFTKGGTAVDKVMMYYTVDANHKGVLADVDTNAVTAKCTEGAPTEGLAVTIEKDGTVTPNWTTDEDLGKTIKNDSFSAPVGS